jgi:SAM-dependent MidA family methyltransferase
MGGLDAEGTEAAPGGEAFVPSPGVPAEEVVGAPLGRPLEAEVAARVRRRGPLPFDEVMALALYDEAHGFYATGGGAGRRGDFLTSPEVGPLFGAVLARALDAWWDELGRPDPFTVVEAGAGRGALAIAVRAARPACLAALTYVLVERSAALRARQGEHLPVVEPHVALPPGPAGGGDGSGGGGDAGGPRFVGLADLPAVPVVGVVLANELLDNLPVRLLERRGGAWCEVRVGLTDDEDGLREVPVPAGDALAAEADRLVPDAPDGARLPIQHTAVDWVRRALGILARGRLVVIDYASSTPELARRPAHEWLRTYRGHARGGPPLRHLGAQDITCEVCVDQLARVRAPDRDRTQAAFLDTHGMAELVEEGRRTWRERSGPPDLAALRARSRVSEAEALRDPRGLGAFRVLEWEVP